MPAVIAIVLAALGGAVIWDVTQTKISFIGVFALLPLLCAGASLYFLRERLRWAHVQWIFALAFIGLRWTIPPRWVTP
jgi:hypothetical protein